MEETQGPPSPVCPQRCTPPRPGERVLCWAGPASAPGQPQREEHSRPKTIGTDQRDKAPGQARGATGAWSPVLRCLSRGPWPVTPGRSGQGSCDAHARPPATTGSSVPLRPTWRQASHSVCAEGSPGAATLHPHLLLLTRLDCSVSLLTRRAAARRRPVCPGAWEELLLKHCSRTPPGACSL